jgi:hypothetical protein
MRNVVVRLWDRETEKVLIDLMKPRELYRATFNLSPDHFYFASTKFHH